MSYGREQSDRCSSTCRLIPELFLNHALDVIPIALFPNIQGLIPDVILALD